MRIKRTRRKLKKIVNKRLRLLLLFFGITKWERRRINFVIIHEGRCGSKVLGWTMLNLHKIIHYTGEIFLEPAKRIEAENPSVILGVTDLDPALLLQKEMDSENTEVFAFEHTPSHCPFFGMTLGEMLRMFQTKDVTHYIYLDRKNTLRRIVSSLVAQQSKSKWHLKEGKKANLKTVSVSVDEPVYYGRTLMRHLEHYERLSQELADLLSGKPYLYLSYEDDIESDPMVAYGKVCGFIGVNEKDVSPGLTKTNPFPLNELIENYDEVAAHLKGTKYEWMLDG